MVVTFLLAYVGHQGDLPVLGSELDHLWLGYGCLVAWLIILPSTVAGLLLGDSTAWRTVSILLSLLTMGGYSSINSPIFSEKIARKRSLNLFLQIIFPTPPQTNQERMLYTHSDGWRG